jgi:PAS domain S-box-containing protein
MRNLETVEVDRSTDPSGAFPDDSLFRVHFDNLPRPAYIWRRHGTTDDFVFVAYNRAAGALTYSNVRALVGCLASSLQAGIEYDMRADLHTCVTQGVIVKREVQYRYIATGAIRNLALTIVPLSADICVLHTEDITERLRTEQALRDSEAKYRAIVDTAHEGILTLDLESTITYANQRAADILGYSVEECVGRKTFEFIDPDMRDVAKRIRASVHGGRQERLDFLLRNRHGRGVWVSASASPLLDANGTVCGVLQMLTDIDERKRAEQALVASEARIRALLDANPDLIVRLSVDGTYLDVHSTDARLAAHVPPLEDFLGRKVEDLFEPEFAREHERHRLLALSTGKMQRWEYTRADPHGSMRHIEARFVKSGDDEVVVMVRDFTQRVELERQVIASTERERTRLGHDLHDGLAQLLIGVKLLLAALTEKLAAAGSVHHKDAQRAADLVSRAIEQTADLAQGLSPIPKRGWLCDALRQLARQSQQLLGVRCEVVRADAPQELNEGTATHLYRIAQEAITNAVKHGKATRIALSCDRLADRLVLEVKDDGCGLAETAPDQGGMGLNIMYYRARNIGGELSVTNRPDGGTVVRCSVPLPAPQPA